MSKIVKVKIKMEKLDGGGTHNKYPQGYNASKINVLAYGGSEETVDNTGYCIGVVKDEDLAGFLATEDVKEISIEEANIFGRKYRPQRTTISDQNKVIEILSKATLSKPLSEQDRKAINPEDEEIGVNKTKLFDVEKHL